MTERTRAHRMVASAKKRGDLVPRPCEVCGSRKRVMAHHEDYSKPLDVNWLCPSCHQMRHRYLREAA